MTAAEAFKNTQSDYVCDDSTGNQDAYCLCIYGTMQKLVRSDEVDPAQSVVSCME